MAERCELHLIRDWDAAWRMHVRPWLAQPGALRRDFVLVPTRGQAHALKLRCVREGLPLLGVEFITPALARQKWRALQPPDQPALGRELLLLNLRSLVADRLAAVGTGAREAGWWQSLASDAERALDDFDDLMHAGFCAADFPAPALAEVFGALERRVAELGYGLGPAQQVAAGLTPPAPDAPGIAGRLLVHGFGAESWREFFVLAALARRAAQATVLLPEPQWREDGAPDEGWVEAWAVLLGAEPMPAETSEPEPAGAGVAQLWTGPAGASPRARVRVGRTRSDEMALVADEVVRLLQRGSDNIAVVFPRADAAHRRLVRLLSRRGVPFNDLLVTPAPPAPDTLLQRGLLEFYDGGARLEGLLELWPRLRALNFTTTPLSAARDVAERVFDRRQTHALADLHADLAARERPDWVEAARVAGLLLPPWPERLTLAAAVERFAAVCASFQLPLPENWPALEDYAGRDRREHPRAAVIAALRSFLPEKAPAADLPGRGLFAPVTLTTRRRAAGLAWSDLVLVESNAGVWPERSESSCWLTDEQRIALNRRSRFTVALFTREHRARFEKDGYAELARGTAGEVVFTAALHDEQEPELVLAPNSWLERVLLATGGQPADADFAGWAAAPAAASASASPEVDAWLAVWSRRRDPSAAFDEHFLCGDPARTRPARIAARLMERAVRDPAELWFEGVLGVRRTGWLPLVRARRRALGSFAHALLAQVLRGPAAEGNFRHRRPEAEARSRLVAALAEWRGQWPRDRYWDSFAAELGDVAEVLLRKAYAIGGGPFVGIELDLPAGTELALGAAGGRITVAGRMDLVWSDRPGWTGATVDIVDFKTGADVRLSAATMARGSSLQLGVYLAAARALGAARGRVWMVKADAAPPSVLELGELDGALAAPLGRLARHLATGRYGALTPDRTEYSRGFEWPLACVAIREAVLQSKFAATFGRPEGDEP